MRYRLIGSTGRYRPHRTVEQLGDFLLSNPEFLYVFKGLFDMELESLEEEEIQVLTISIMTQSQLVLEVRNDARVRRFSGLMREFVSRDLVDSGNTRGQLLEYLVYKKGPLSFRPIASMRIFRHCQVVQEDGTPVGGSSNMDLGFVAWGKKRKNFHHLELVDCKFNLVNFLDNSSRCKKKLQYMLALTRCQICPEYVVGFVTLSTGVRDCIAYLKQEGYDELTVYGYREVEALLSS